MSTTSIAILLYFFTRLDSIGGALGFLSFTSTLLVVVCVIVGLFVQYPMAEDGHCNECGHLKDAGIKIRVFGFKQLRWVIPVIILHLLWPTQKDMAFIVGGALGYEAVTFVANDTRVHETGGKAFDALNTWLDNVAAENAQEIEEQP